MFEVRLKHYIYIYLFLLGVSILIFLFVSLFSLLFFIINNVKDYAFLSLKMRCLV